MSTLTSWAEEIKIRYISGESSIFLLHGNVRDLFLYEDDKGKDYLNIQDYLHRFLGRTKESILYYNISDGVSINNKRSKIETINKLRAYGMSEGSGSVTGVLKSAENMILKEESSCAINR